MAENITKDKVASAYNQLIAEGEKPTGDKILAKIGSGSKGTVVKYLREVRNESHEKQAVLSEQLGVGSDFINALNKEIYRYIEFSKKRSEELLEQTKEAEMFAILALQTEEEKNTELVLLIEKLRGDITQFKENEKVHLATYKAKTEELQNALSEKEEDIKILSESRDSALKEVAKFEIRIEDNDKLAQRHEQDFSKAQDKISTLTEELNSTRGEQIKLGEKLSNCKGKITELEADKENLTKKVESLQESKDKVNGELQNAKGEIVGSEKQIENLSKQLTEKESSLQTASEQIINLRSENIVLNKDQQKTK